MEKSAPPLYTLFYAGHGGSVAQIAPYQKGGVVHLGGGMTAKSAKFLPDEACLPPLWTGANVDQVQPHDLLTSASLGLDTRGRFASWLTWPYAEWIRRRHGMTQDPPLPIAPLPWRMNIAQADDTAHALSYTRDALAKMPPAARVVLFGRSRGSLVALNVLVSLTHTERQRVAAVLLEGLFPPPLFSEP